MQLAQAFLHAGERLKRRLQRLNTAVAGVVPLLQLAQGQAAGLLQLPLQAGRGKLRRGIDPGGNILAARDLDAAVFNRSNTSRTLSNREMPRVIVCRLISSHAAVMKSAWSSSANTRISSGHMTVECLMRTVSITQPSESMQIRNSRFLVKSVSAFAIKTVSLYQLCL